MTDGTICTTIITSFKKKVTLCYFDYNVQFFLAFGKLRFTFNGWLPLQKQFNDIAIATAMQRNALNFQITLNFYNLYS